MDNDQHRKEGDEEPLKWNDFFDDKQALNIDGDSFNVYRKGNSGPLFYFVHGGGYTGLTWACLVEELCSKISCQVIAPDLRGHGETVAQDSTDLSLERQVKDLCNIYRKMYDERVCERVPPLFLVGHSMGGALVAHVANQNLLPKLVALAVIDVVEGSAMAALTLMGSFLRTRPQQFPTHARAIKWCVESGTTRNVRAARISMPSQIVEETNAKGEKYFRWRTNLSKTQPHWNGWFKGLSRTFLGCSSAKILILANVDRLDKELLTGQMRGMFQTEVLPKVGHAVHEDSPDLVAQIFVNLIKRYKVIIDKM